MARAVKNQRLHQETLRRIRQQVRETAFTQGVRLTLSIGAASFPEHASRGEDRVRTADEVAYTAKRSGRDQVHVARPPGPRSIPPASGSREDSATAGANSN